MRTKKKRVLIKGNLAYRRTGRMLRVAIAQLDPLLQFQTQTPASGVIVPQRFSTFVPRVLRVSWQD